MLAHPEIAVCSLSCRYPDAHTPDQLWTNIVSGRRSFRPLPPQRLALAAYTSSTIGTADSITPIFAGLLANWEFDREKYLISKRTFENTDLTHWLALDLASEAIECIGGLENIDRGRTAVIVANTLTGEFSRSSLLRMRLPFFDEILRESLSEIGTDAQTAERLRNMFAAQLRQRFPEPNEDSLAGGLANTIAGRIANYFDLNGGAYSVDGACSSSLLAIANASTLLDRGEVDCAIVGAVDLSLDPFELVGFSRNGALSSTRMRVFDARSDGFWPGEGGAFSVLMRLDDARKKDIQVMSVLRGWGMSTDGAGGLTRPTSRGQLLAYKRAYERANVDPRDVDYVEAHGTGTAIGDPTEVKALAALREQAGAPLPIGSIKANIGHTKAAAGFAGFVKAVMAIRHGGIPPHIGCDIPHPVFNETAGAICIAQRARAFETTGQPLIGVSSFGFGGINLHVILEGANSVGRRELQFVSLPILGEQEAELFMFCEEDNLVLLQKLTSLRNIAPTLSISELTDAAATAAKEIGQGGLRVAFVASNPDELCQSLDEAIQMLSTEGRVGMGTTRVYLGSSEKQRIGFLFSGQAAPVLSPSPVWLARFPFLKRLKDSLTPKIENGSTDTKVAQPAITYANLAAAQVLNKCGIFADIVTGHSVGELAALSYAGALIPSTAVELATSRGMIMSAHGKPGGVMLRLGLSVVDASRLAENLDCTCACINGPADTIWAGAKEPITVLSDKAKKLGASCQFLRVSHAFHSPDMAAAKGPLRALADSIQFQPLTQTIVSTVTGRVLEAGTDLPQLLAEQLVQPVRFVEALDAVSKQADLLIEMGPGTALTRLAKERGLNAVAIQSQTANFENLLSTLAAAFVGGHNLDFNALFGDRSAFSFDATRRPQLLSNPCGIKRGSGKEPAIIVPLSTASSGLSEPKPLGDVQHGGPLSSETVLGAIRTQVSEETGLPQSKIDAEARFQSDLHLNSLAVSRIVTALCQKYKLPEVQNPTDFADATPIQLASHFVEMHALGIRRNPNLRINGVRNWTASYAMQWYATDPVRPSKVKVKWSNGIERTKIDHTNTAGVLISLDQVITVNAAMDLVSMLQSALKGGIRHLAVLHDGAPISAFFRSLHQERSFDSILVVDRNGHDQDDKRIGELLETRSNIYREFRLSKHSGLERPVFQRKTDAPQSNAGQSVTCNVVLAIGCHRGIGLECALSLAQESTQIILAGRSAPGDALVLETLELSKKRGIQVRYFQCDITDATAVIELRQRLTSADLVPVVLLYAPGHNEPMRLASLKPETVKAALLPKTVGLSNVLSCFGTKLQKIFAFGSIIGRIGLEGESHYALANAMQSQKLEEFSNAHPQCQCLSLEWTVWSGAGMGERLGTIERLAAKGVDALTFDDAIHAFKRHVEQGTTGTIAITSRFGPPPDLDIGKSALQSLRFADKILIDFPGTELVVETELNNGRDLYLGDHIVDGQLIFPGVMGLEAMAQIAASLCGGARLNRISDIVFQRPILVGHQTRIRIAALRIDRQIVETAIFGEGDDFAASYLKARFLVASHQATHLDGNAVSTLNHDSYHSAAALYGQLFFHGERFRVVESLGSATSRRVVAKLGPNSSLPWFGDYESQELVLYNPGICDAALHALQAAVPHRRVLPLSIGEVHLTANFSGARFLVGAENWTAGHSYSFDVAALDESGSIVAEWKDIRFRAISEISVGLTLKSMPTLCQPYLERIAREELQDETLQIRIAEQSAGDRAQRHDLVVRELGLEGKVTKRADGRPMLPPGDGYLSLSHTEEITCVVTGKFPVSCDIVVLDEPFPESLSAESWTRGEVLRKLGVARPFSHQNEQSLLSISSVEVCSVFYRSIPSLRMAISIGTIRPRVELSQEVEFKRVEA